LRPLAQLGHADAGATLGLFFDLDDTVLTHGALSHEAYDSMWRAREAGLVLVAITGRPCAWGEVLARQWPVAGVVVENGALAIVREGPGVRVLDRCDPQLRARRAQMLAEVARAVSSASPELAFADDSWCRRTDITWDIGEKDHPGEDVVTKAIAAIEGVGAKTFRSSVHLHATFDRTDKAQGAVRFARDVLGVDESRALARFGFAGDSANDAACFAAFHLTFGVANVQRHLARLPVPPRWVANAEMGAGFAEIVNRLIEIRRASATISS
jgi:HAD superfamily hydrolase (TIGR01484 family)